MSVFSPCSVSSNLCSCQSKQVKDRRCPGMIWPAMTALPGPGVMERVVAGKTVHPTGRAPVTGLRRRVCFANFRSWWEQSRVWLRTGSSPGATENPDQGAKQAGRPGEN
ncbi:hypothetical protein ElyMa_003177200 [Elysia marginata]|uniref:Uncharacterized protein n=1 Tax=Elysia marginata TaxID=1093978 RepID=A0AAV4IYH2_9GAST|nr:hypothetical protein ElyMa_003177200 [Elysia marginata]